MHEATNVTFDPIRSVAANLGVPAAWLKAEAEAGRIPHLKTTGNRILANVEEVRRALIERSRSAVVEKGAVR